MVRSFNWLNFSARTKRCQTRSLASKSHFNVEALEPRIALSAAGLVPIGSQPAGPLSGKIVYVSGGHGLEWNSNISAWYAGRDKTQEMNEAYGNQDQLTYYADYLLRAGATVVPMRPIGHQVNEVVLDNDSSGVTFSGSWPTSAGARYYDEDYGAGDDGDDHYRYANATAAETAVATYTPTITAAGFYPVYTWAAHGSNRTSQLYKINHTGGQTQVRIDHSQVGNGWVYLGTYYFAQGTSPTSGSVQISNEGAAGKVVIADAIRFGNGMGDVKGGPGGVGAASGTVSGASREDEAALMWLWRSVGQGYSSPSNLIGTNNVTAPGIMARHMNVDANPFGTSVYVGFHSNAANGTARGTVGLVHSSSGTPNQSFWAGLLAEEIEEDFQARPSDFEYPWATRNNTLSGGYGEISNAYFGGEMDATIIEVAFHDNAEDAALLRDPKARDQIGRSSYEATLKYFDAYGGLTAPMSVASKPTNVSATSAGSGEVTIRWSAGPTGVYGDAATGFRIYASTDGYGFDGGTLVAGAGATTATLAGYDPTIPYYFKVVAVNAGGESLSSEVIAVIPNGGEKQILIVNGFDRYDRTQNARVNTPGGTIDRVWARYNNSFDYVVQVASAIHASSPGIRLSSTSNEAVISGAVNLADYDAVIWILGNESTADRTFDASEQTKVEAFIAGGGHFFATGSEIGWDLDQADNGRSFFEGTLKSNYVSDDANTYTVVAPAGGIFAGLSFSFDNGSQFYNVNYPDVIAPQAGAISALTYSGGTGGSAGVQTTGTNGRGNVVVFGFPFETITTAANRAAVMDRVLDFFGIAAVVTPAPTGDFNGDGIVDGADFLAWQRGFGAAIPTLASGDADQNGVVDGADLETWKTQFGTPGAAPASEPAIAARVAPFAVASLEAAEEDVAADGTSQPLAATSDYSWLAFRPSQRRPAAVGEPLTLRKGLETRQAWPARFSSSQSNAVAVVRRGLDAACDFGDDVDNSVVDLAFEAEAAGDDWTRLR